MVTFKDNQAMRVLLRSPSEDGHLVVNYCAHDATLLVCEDDAGEDRVIPWSSIESILLVD